MKHSLERLELATLPGCGVGRGMSYVQLRLHGSEQHGRGWGLPNIGRDADG
jgi:hypothetical protein